MAGLAAGNATMAKFGYPATLVADYERWVVLLRPQQATLGALVLACREPVTAFSAISREAFGELAGVVADIEGALARAFAFNKINYLMLMMVDPHVHFHVLPRYDRERAFAGLRFVDPGWPRAPDLSQGPQLTESSRDELLTLLRAQWAERRR